MKQGADPCARVTEINPLRVLIEHTDTPRLCVINVKRCDPEQET